MKLKDLLDSLEYKADSLPDEEVIDLTSDSRRVQKGFVFVCVKGEKVDGHDYAQAAARQGCVAIVAEHTTEASVPHILVGDTHKAYALMCGNFFGNPSKRLKLVGVTGTNGKTTTAFLVKEILEMNGHKSGLIGTIQNMAGDEILPAQYTTPEPYELHKTFKKIADAGCEYLVMEVSSHALAQERVAGCFFESAVFTNLTQDHLDFHKTMENYLQAKLRLFTMCGAAIVNLDDAASTRILSAAHCPTFTYSAHNMEANFTARDIRYRADGIDYELVGKGVIGRVSAPLPGGFSVHNTLAAAACAVSLGLSFDHVVASLCKVKGVKGRIEVVPTSRDFTVIIDYAHTPDALEKILLAIKGFAQGRIVALFGCGGDRDKTKRPLMGEVAAQNADYLIVTSDNPRTEEPDAIIGDIIPGVEKVGTPYKIVVNRRDAIKCAIENARKDDIIVLAGKGHEDYQIIGREKHHFDEREVVAGVLQSLTSRR